MKLNIVEVIKEKYLNIRNLLKEIRENDEQVRNIVFLFVNSSLSEELVDSLNKFIKESNTVIDKNVTYDEKMLKLLLLRLTKSYFSQSEWYDMYFNICSNKARIRK